MTNLATPSPSLPCRPKATAPSQSAAKKVVQQAAISARGGVVSLRPRPLARPVAHLALPLNALQQFATYRLADAERARATKVLNQLKFPCSCGRSLAQCASASPRCLRYQRATDLLLTRLQQGISTKQVTREVRALLEQGEARAAQASAVRTTPTSRQSESLVRVPLRGAPFVGPADASLTLVAFVDLSHHSSRAVWELFQRLQLHYGLQEVRFALRHFPMPVHQLSTMAAEASMCAHAQSAFWPYVEKLFGHRGVLAHNHLIGYAKELKLDLTRFNRDLTSGVFRRQVARDTYDAINILRLPGAPFAFINGLPVRAPHKWAHVAAKAWQRAQQLIQQGVPPQHLYDFLIKQGKRSLKTNDRSYVRQCAEEQ